MKVYTFTRDYNNPYVEMGDTLDVDGVEVKVLSIIKVDFAEQKIWFSGVPTDSMY